METPYHYTFKFTAREIGQLEGALQFLIETNLSTAYLKTSFESLLRKITMQFETERLELRYGSEDSKMMHSEESDDAPSS